MTPLLVVDSLSVHLASGGGQSQTVLTGVSLQLAAGEILAVVGESGAGKSTLASAILGPLPVDAGFRVAGKIWLEGEDLLSVSQAAMQAIRRARLRAVPQAPLASLDPTMTIGAQIGQRAAAVFWLQRTGITDAQSVLPRYPHQISGGQRQRVLLAMALMVRPRLVIADEPTTSLDPVTKGQVLNLLRATADDEKTGILLVTHDLEAAASVADHILVLHEGRVVETGPARQLLSFPWQDYTKSLLACRYNLTTDRSAPLPAAGAEGSTASWSSIVADGGVALALDQVSRSFRTGQLFASGRSAVLRDISLRVGAGESLALVGASGAGKSTLLRVAAGLDRPDSGTVARTVGDRPQIVFQDATSAFTPWLTIGEQIGERLASSGCSLRERQQRTAEALNLCGLDPALARLYPSQLSVGQCQRAAFARAIVVPPNLLLCDEPVSAMDVRLTAAMLNLINRLRRQLRFAVLLVTHDIAAARLVADRIAVLHEGRIVETGEADAIIERPTSPYTRELIDAVRQREAA